MTSEEIIQSMRSVCDSDKVDAWHNGFWTLTQEELERFAALVEERAAAAEREACAKVAEDCAGDCYIGDADWEEAKRCAAAIRARGIK